MKEIVEENGKIIVKNDKDNVPSLNDVLNLLSIILLNQINEEESEYE